jgi:hypothetical protein
MRSLLKVLVVLSIVATIESSAFAQRAMYNPSAAGGWGAGTYRPYTARTYSRHAINHTQTLQYYGQNNESIAQGTAQEHAAEIRRNVDAFTKEIAKLPKEWENDPEAAKLIAEIRTHQKQAVEHCGMLEAECVKHMAAGGAVMQCCTDMLKHMRAADTAHDKLMKYLKIPMPGEKAASN